MTPDQIKQLQTTLGVPATGVLDAATTAAYSTAVTKALSTNPTVKQFAGGNDPISILNAYQTGDWSGVTSLSGVPFTPDQQKAAVASATNALTPGFTAQNEEGAATAADTLRKNQEGLSDFESSQAKQFATDKGTLDQNAANNGVLFAGSRVQKNNDLRTSYATADAEARRNASEAAATATRDYQYQYGTPAAESLSSLYQVPGATRYDANVAAGTPGSVTPSRTLSAAYNPEQYGFQGTQPVAQKTAIQTRAASLLANNANKLSLKGYTNSF